MITLRSTRPGLGFGLGAGSFPLHIAKGFPPVFFCAVCFVQAMQETLPHVCMVLGL